MADARARQFYDQDDFVGLFRYIEPMWIVATLRILDELCDRDFYPNPGNYQTELRQAGIFVERLEVAMAAVLHKRGRSITWGKYWELYREKLSKLPAQQHREIREYWGSGSKPGLLGPGDEPAPTIGTTGDWFVTALGGTTESLVVSVGFTALTGIIAFTRADGTKSSHAIGVMGPSAGVSVVPGTSKVGAALAQRFPILKLLIFPESAPKLGNELLKWFITSPSAAARALRAAPGLIKVMPKIRTVAEVATGASLGPASLPSPAIGLVCGNSRAINKGDFAGACVMFAAVGTAGVGSGGVFVLAFGLPRAWNPFTDPAVKAAKGYALIAGAAASLQIPSLGAAETLFWGEIV
jgi:hypothetical protein